MEVPIFKVVQSSKYEIIPNKRFTSNFLSINQKYFWKKKSLEKMK